MSTDLVPGMAALVVWPPLRARLGAALGLAPPPPGGEQQLLLLGLTAAGGAGAGAGGLELEVLILGDLGEAGSDRTARQLFSELYKRRRLATVEGTYLVPHSIGIKTWY